MPGTLTYVTRDDFVGGLDDDEIEQVDEALAYAFGGPPELGLMLIPATAFFDAIRRGSSQELVERVNAAIEYPGTVTWYFLYE